MIGPRSEPNFEYNSSKTAKNSSAVFFIERYYQDANVTVRDYSNGIKAYASKHMHKWDNPKSIAAIQSSI